MMHRESVQVWVVWVVCSSMYVPRTKELAHLFLLALPLALGLCLLLQLWLGAHLVHLVVVAHGVNAYFDRTDGTDEYRCY
jgi:hypothetical protein